MPQSFTELFERDFPYYLSIGMTYEQYWYGDVWLVKAYREADVQRQKRQNNEAWLQGLYFWDAVAKAVSNLGLKEGQQQEYVKEPFEIFGDEKNRKEEAKEQEALQAKAYMRQMERAGRNWGKT